MLKNIFRKLGLSAVLFSIVLVLLLSTALKSVGVMSNLEDYSHSQPNKAQLSECLADVKQVTAWSDAETTKAARDICEIRKAHATAKSRFATALVELNEQYKYTNNGLSNHLPSANKDAQIIVESCIDFKE